MDGLQGYHATTFHCLSSNVPTSSTTRQKQYQIGNIIGSSKLLLEDNLLSHAILEIRGNRRRHGRIDKAGKDTIHPNIPWGHFPGQGLGQGQDASLAGGIVGLSPIPLRRHDGRKVDNGGGR